MRCGPHRDSRSTELPTMGKPSSSGRTLATRDGRAESIQQEVT